MPGLTLIQPWATLVSCGAKRVETRSWHPSAGREHPLPLAIHAAKRFPQAARALCYEPPFAEALARAGIDSLGGLDVEEQLPRGRIIAVAWVLDWAKTEHSLVWDDWAPFGSEERAFGDYGCGRWAWLLTNVRRLPESIPCKGVLGLWTVPPAIWAAMEAQLGPHAPEGAEGGHDD